MNEYLIKIFNLNPDLYNKLNNLVNFTLLSSF